ncbi:uncharacterized protein LOC129737705 [Uranotaenia lowii]|uniref:uncharacterized protein LOC129737705 n=1 Tax=Uranotaenia lowii TaxID=190385 RepID=UPI0024793F04|nr:uncharacterized protein LOC129737705 [Uranotaenia lowii]
MNAHNSTFSLGELVRPPQSGLGSRSGKPRIGLAAQDIKVGDFQWIFRPTHLATDRRHRAIEYFVIVSRCRRAEPVSEITHQIRKSWKSKLCLRNKLLIYKQVFRPAIMYAVPIWSSCCATRKKAIQRIQNKVLKIILRLRPWHSTEDLYRIAGIESIEEMANNIISNFRCKSMQSSIAEIRSLYN